MIGRKQRKRVVFVDGIPIEATILDAGASGLKSDDVRADPAALATLDPRALFDKYDADGSGGIDFDEFRVLLADLQIALSEPKARVYFRRCDVRRHGSISFEEFRLALYTCDPKNPSRTIGFAPGQSLSPKDLFEMFDRDEQGALDRATFIELLAFLGKKLALADIEGIFAANEDPELEMMGYHQFKKVWLSLVDVRAELRGRHERFNRFLPTSVLAKKLEALVTLEEKQEAKTLLEAANSLEDERVARERRELVDDAQLLARVALGEALDAAGQVYVFGKGPFGCFDGEPVQPDFADFLEFGLVQELWTARVRPSSAATAPALVLEREPAGGPGSPEPGRPETEDSAATQSPGASTTQARTPLESRSRIAVAAAARAFANRQVSLATAFLWAKRVRSVACGAVAAFAVTDAGEVFCWGGKQRAWRYFYDQSSALASGADGDTVERPLRRSGGARPALPNDPGRPLTTRSEILKLSLPTQAARNQGRHNASPLRTQYARTFVKPERILPTVDDERARLLLAGRYYDLLPPAPAAPPLSPAPSPTAPLPTAPSLQELLETVEPELNVDDLALSLQMRGVYLAKQTRVELLAKLGDCLALELECVGEAFHAHMKAQDAVARRLRHARRENAMVAVAGKTAALWSELGFLQTSIVAAEHDAFRQDQKQYLDMKHRIVAAKQRTKRQAREGFDAPGRHGDATPVLLAHANGLTARGSPLQDFNGQQAVECVAVGSRHAIAVHQSGTLLTWGVGSFGRLGGAHDGASPERAWDPNDPTAWHSDVHAPAAVDALKQHRFRAVACGFSHSMALTSRGQVFVWGSATHGKLGIGPVGAAESFTLAPVLLSLPRGVVVRKIACGPSHSALLSTDGHLYVWGSGDGGKLGLGDGRDVGQDGVPRNGGSLGVLAAPTRVREPFADEKLVEVSCGVGHTAVLSATVAATQSGHAGDTLVGGRVFVAGSNHALAKFTPTFTALAIAIRANEHVPMARVSCGSAHTALRPGNLCLLDGVHAVQSTQNASCRPGYALRSSALGEYAQTQQETCPFWQVTLQRMSRIESVRIVVWSAAAGIIGGGTARQASSSGPRLKYSVLTSPFPFDTEERGKYSLAVAKRHSTHAEFALRGPEQTEWVWTLPVDTFGQHVRVQLDNASGMLGLRAVEVVGTDATAYKGPKVSDVSCGEAVTAAVCRPLSSADALRERFLRAVRADRASLWVLQQIESFHPFLRDELVVDPGHRGSDCVLCRPKETCVACLVERAVLADGKVDTAKRIVTTDGGYDNNAGRARTAATTAAVVRAREKEAEESEALRRLTLEELCHKLLTMNMRTEEEEAAQQQQLEQQLLDMNVFAAGDKPQQTGVGAGRGVTAQGVRGRVSGRSAADTASSGILSKLKRVFGRKVVSANQKVLAAE
ncbi:hypothetical protein PybrP1_003335 [[Pythium] brassicae (nom. inval.)]|nr:hypothetical protein PybrP1_003335 [[Pythium] brassicae (nom. inval.)]